MRMAFYQVLTSDAGEDPECHAAKLLEVVLIQFKGQIDQVRLPLTSSQRHKCDGVSYVIIVLTGQHNDKLILFFIYISTL